MQGCLIIAYQQRGLRAPTKGSRMDFRSWSTAESNKMYGWILAKREESVRNKKIMRRTIDTYRLLNASSIECIVGMFVSE